MILIDIYANDANDEVHTICRSHPFEPHKYATAAEQDAHLEFLLGWVRDDYTRSTVPRQQEIVRAPRPPHFLPEPGVTRVAP